MFCFLDISLFYLNCLLRLLLRSASPVASCFPILRESLYSFFGQMSKRVLKLLKAAVDVVEVRVV